MMADWLIWVVIGYLYGVWALLIFLVVREMRKT
jgi:hypothetical protein